MVKKVQRKNYKGPVYDLEVLTTNSYNIGGLAVHNSVTGSLVSYLLGITKINPIKHKLNFGRFLNDGRLGQNEDGSYYAKTPADIDIDFQHDRKKDVRKRLEDLYGENNTAGITTFMKLEDKAAIKDVANVFDVPFFTVNKFTTSMSDSIEDALETDAGKAFQKQYPEVIKHALKIRGKIKATSTHAAGIVITDHDLRQSETTHLVRSKDGLKTIALSMDNCDDQGMLKLDCLSLSNLSSISLALELIKKEHGLDLDLTNIDLDDQDVLKSINDGYVVGMFQAGTWSMKTLIEELGVSSFNDLVASLALVRPGCQQSGITEEYIRRKNGGEWEKKHPIYEEITKDTYSLVIFQEQILDILTKISGLSMQVADKIRKIIGKKRDAIHFAPYKKQFLEGCEKMGYFSQEEGEKFWDELQASASYSFSKNHSVPYAKITYDTAYLKHYYPGIFISASLTAGAEKKKKELVEEAQRLGVKIKTPKVGVSLPDQWIFKNNTLYIPFLDVKGIGPTTCEAAATAKEDNGGFFQVKDKKKKSKKLETILNDLKAYSDENPGQESLDKYFDFEIILDYDKKYPQLARLNDDHFNLSNWGDLLNCRVPKSKIIRKKPSPKNYLRGLGVCKDCDCVDNCKKPIKPEFGKYNVMIVGESPSWEEDKYGTFKSKEYEKILFPILKKAGLERDFFYLTNILKCPIPRGEKIINYMCKWLSIEIPFVKPNVILAFGNGAMKIFYDKENGIKKMNGKTEWNEKYGAYICYCVRPGTALWGGIEGEEEVMVGLTNFVKTVRNLGLDEKRY